MSDMSKPKELDMSAAMFVAMRNKDREAAAKAKASREMLIKWMSGMKLIVLGIFLLGIFILAGYITSPATEPKTRSRTGEIISQEGKSVIIKTDDGNLWKVNRENIKVVFDTNGTEGIKDDEIISLSL